ncbi:hypothetical protein [Streptomyces sp. XD-27]|uniref:hypothetical protein n=1 Tax=Streptomyces sp. XD-27 TaxID=3062779 RepID=UPI0026F4149D|nr:hypothetical protein [Streptomyces sp. XD-27]WKX70975.1 hypothetical protein Q3Y56_14605 [Streptomyces sp. XD-27]
MLKSAHKRRAEELLGGRLAAGEWCEIGAIPKPPEGIHEQAGKGPLKPGFIGPGGVLGYILVSPILLFFGFFAAVEVVLEVILYGLTYPFRAGKRREAARALEQEQNREESAVASHRLNEVFDGDWNAAAGQLLLHWYGQSSHPKRLVLLAPGRIVIAAPPKRVVTGAVKKMRIVAEMTGEQAVIEDPLHGEGDTGKFRIRFFDGSWLVLTAADMPSDIHTCLKVMRKFDAGNSENLPVRINA